MRTSIPRPRTLDDILDYLKGAATRISLHKVDEITADEEKLATLIHQAVTELHTAVLSLHDLEMHQKSVNRSPRSTRQ